MKLELTWLGAFASIASAPCFYLLLRLVNQGFEEDWTNIMSYDQPIPCLPFSCLVTPAVWASRLTLLCSRDAGLAASAFWSDFLLWEELGGRLCACESNVCLRICAISDLGCVLRWWESVCGCMDVHVCTMPLCGRLANLAHRFR